MIFCINFFFLLIQKRSIVNIAFISLNKLFNQQFCLTNTFITYLKFEKTIIKIIV